MQAYTGFAYVYDEYMDNIPYEEWCEYLVERLKEQGVTPDMEIADLGCGTGTVVSVLTMRRICLRLPQKNSMRADRKSSIVYRICAILNCRMRLMPW